MDNRINAVTFLLTGENSKPIRSGETEDIGSQDALKGMSLGERLERMKELATGLIEDGLLTDEEIQAAQAARDKLPVRNETQGATP